MKAYIAGKITGNQNYKEEFAMAEKNLKDKGYKVMNPTCLPEGFEQFDYLSICATMIDICDEVFFLPTWEDSKGSCFEYGYSLASHKPVHFLKNINNLEGK